MAFHSGDKEQVQRWLSWVEELGGLGRHRLFIMPCKGQVADFQTSIPFEAVPDSQGIVSDWSSPGSLRDASGPNTMLRQFAWFFYPLNGERFGAWTFIEPDCIPLRSGWADEWEREYQQCGKPFMAAFVPGIPNMFPDHATGNMVLPERCVELSRLLMLPSHIQVEGDPSGRMVELAFDVAAAPDILPKCHFTNLLQHVFRGADFEKMDDLARISPAAVLWHTDKSGGLIRLLRAKKLGLAEGFNADTRKIGAGVTGGRETPAVERLTVPTEGSNPSSKPRVHTYFRPCVDQAAFEEQKRILAIWEKNWRDNGWEPVILTEVHARKHPDYERLKVAFAAIPTVNPPAYEQAAFHRWIAMSLCGGLMVDYDTLNNGWEFSNGVLGKFPTILSDNNPVPCAVVGTREQYQNAIDAFLTCPMGSEKGQPHLSDQLAVQALRFPAFGICIEFGKNQWEIAKLIHFSHAACGKERSKRMQEFVARPPEATDADFQRGPEQGPQFRHQSDGLHLNADALNATVIKHGIRPVESASTTDCIDRLLALSKKDGFAKARIRKQLRAAGLIPKK